MKNRILFFCLVVFCFGIWPEGISSTNTTNSNFSVRNLVTEYTSCPLGIDVERPRFSWQMVSEVACARQTAWQIVVTDEGKRKVWDSGKVGGDLSLNIEYAGAPLLPSTRYTWQVTVWNGQQQTATATSWFETGLMHRSNGWSGAKWIGASDDELVLYAQYLPVFKISYSLQLDERSGSTQAGFIYGANDERLMDRNKNEFALQSAKDESFLMVVVDISPLDSGREALLHVFRNGYHPEDKRDVPFRSFTIPPSVINRQNRYDEHRILIHSNLGYTHIFLHEEIREMQIGELNLNPLGAGGDFLAFPVVADLGFYVPGGQAASFRDVQIRNYRSPSNKLFSVYDTEDYVLTGGSSGRVVTLRPEGYASPVLRTAFAAPEGKVAKARLYATARGIYDLHLNGRRVGDDYFNPGATQYNSTHLYQTFDVTDLIQAGDNALGATLAEGWWSGGATFMGHNWNYFGDRQSLLAKLVITYCDGTEQVVITDPATWQYYNNGPVRYGSFFQGEVYDARREEMAGDWKPASEIPLAGTISHYTDPGVPAVDDYSGFRLTGQTGQTVKAIKELAAVSVDEIRPGVFVYDMGQNMVGVPKIELSGMQPGRQINLRYAEFRYPDLPAYSERTGMVMMENIRAAMTQDVYICRGGREVIQPRFTFHGYRYVEITGIDKAIPVEAVKGTVLSSIHELASYYETSNPKVNKLWENITWSTHGNFLSIPTDCPQRNERLGWSGDISVFSPTATYLADVPQFLARHIRAMRDTQREDGRFADIAPLGGGFGGILWGSAGIIVAWESYRQFGDVNVLTAHYEAMQQYIVYLIKQIDPETNVMGEKFRSNWGSLGDWLSPEYDRTEKSLLWEAYFIYDLHLMSRIATILDKEADAQFYGQFCHERKAFFNRTYLDNSGRTVFRGNVVDTQASYVVPLAFGIPEGAIIPLVRERLLATLTRENRTDSGTECPPYSLMTGFIGTAWIMQTLSEAGYTDAAYRLLQQTSYPSWLYPVEQGATTIWEHLNSYTHTDGFAGDNRMNSFNHYSFGAVGSWLYRHSLGIERDEAHPGFKHFILSPEPDPTRGMTYAKGHYDSMYGRICSSWEFTGETCVYEFEVPANTSATVYLRGAIGNVYSRGNAHPMQGMDYLGEKDGKHVFKVQSGSYCFEMK